MRNSRHFAATFGQALLGAKSPRWLDRMADDGALVGPAAGRAKEAGAADVGCLGDVFPASRPRGGAWRSRADDDGGRAPAPDLEEWARTFGGCGEEPLEDEDGRPTLEAEVAAARKVVSGKRRGDDGGGDGDGAGAGAGEAKAAAAQTPAEEHAVMAQLSSFLDRSLDPDGPDGVAQ